MSVCEQARIRRPKVKGGGVCVCVRFGEAWIPQTQRNAQTRPMRGGQINAGWKRLVALGGVSTEVRG